MSRDELPEDIDYEKIHSDNRNSRIFIVCIFGFLILLSVICFLGSLTSCTISFQNISTHGNAQDLGDEDLTSSPDISPDISVPAIGM